MRGRHIFAGALLIALLSLTACGGGPTEEVDPGAEQWTAVQEALPNVEAKRAELKALQEKIAAGPAEGEEGPSEEELTAQLDAMKTDVLAVTDDLYGKAIGYINSQSITVGEEYTPEQRQAFDIKAEIDVQYAQEYVDRAGDYQKAISIYEQALMSDPGNQILLDAKATAEDLRHMDEERFSQVKKGMGQDEVRALLGTVKPSNVQEYEAEKRVGWFYRKDNGGAAGVFFKQKSDNWVVEVLDFEAIKPKVIESQG